MTTSSVVCHLRSYHFVLSFTAFILLCIFLFFFNDTATTEIYTLSLHDALPISGVARSSARNCLQSPLLPRNVGTRSEEHTSELQSPMYLVCRLLLEKKKKKIICLMTNMKLKY